MNHLVLAALSIGAAASFAADVAPTREVAAFTGPLCRATASWTPEPLPFYAPTVLHSRTVTLALRPGECPNDGAAFIAFRTWSGGRIPDDGWYQLTSAQATLRIRKVPPTWTPVWRAQSALLYVLPYTQERP